MRTSVSTSKVAQEIIARRRISDNRINNAKRAANSFATRLEKTEANLAKVNSSIAGLKDTGIFSSEKARLEMIKLSK
jgi:ABC-type transporter Mla subunit MlaD